MLELCLLSTPVLLVFMVHQLIQDLRGRRSHPWSMCAVSGGCRCSLPKVCAQENCQCSRPKVCVDHCRSGETTQACADLDCDCGLPKVVAEAGIKHC